MKNRMLLGAALVLMLNNTAQAQDPMGRLQDAAVDPAEEYSRDLQTRYYEEQLRRYDDPKEAVRRKAEFRAAQRQRRIAAMKWYGYSASRPTVNPTPWAQATVPPGPTARSA